MPSPTPPTANMDTTTEISPIKPPPSAHTQRFVNRRPLGEVSPNLQTTSSTTKVAAAQTPAFMSKALAGSPLKRSFTAAIEGGGGAGLSYFKRRRLGEEISRSRDGEGEESRGGADEGMREEGSFRPVFRSGDEGEGDEVPTGIVPVITELSPTEPNTPSSSPEDELCTQDSSQERKSFSSLINYDPSSQTSTSIFKTVSNAELLRIRLQVAMYKVRTNQIDTPFVDLRVNERKPMKAAAAVEEAVAQLKKEAHDVAERDRRRAAAVGNLLPAPLLQPTAYSTRFIFDDGDAMPSSPPLVGVSPEKLPTTTALVGDVATPRRLGMGFDSPSSGRKRILAPPGEQELTSSVVKGRVAEGLLGLRNAA